MLNILIGSFTTESNTNVPYITNLGNYELCFDNEVINKMGLVSIKEQEGINLIPSLYANANAASLIDYSSFKYIEETFIQAVRDNLEKIDGIYLHLHGASYVENIGSGDHHILKEIRKIVGPYLPIAISCDPHGNLTKEYVENCTIIRSYRESPHTDAAATRIKVLYMLIAFLYERQNIHAIYRKLPLILGGEQSVSTDEPVSSINKYMDEMEKDPRVRSVSWHVGYIRHDCPEAGCGVVVVPQTADDQEYCETKADELAKFVWDRRHEFHYTGLTAQPEEAMKMALEFSDKPVMITDSGDNTTSGSTGWNTYVLRQALAQNSDKKFLFANICDPNAFAYLNSLEVGTTTNIKLGMNHDENSTSVDINVTLKAKGYLRGYMMHVHDAVYGHSVLVHINGTNIDVNVASTRQVMCEKHQFDACGIDWDNYDIIVVKQGYAFPEIKEKGKLVIMSLTDGATLQDTAKLPFKRIMRPMYPIDKI